MPKSLARIEREINRHAQSTYSYISVTDEVKVNEQDKSVATGPLYVRTELCGRLEPYGDRTL